MRQDALPHECGVPPAPGTQLSDSSSRLSEKSRVKSVCKREPMDSLSKGPLKRVLLAFCLVLALRAVAGEEQLEQPAFAPWPHLELKLGAELTAIDSQVGFETKGGGQPKIDMEDKLGLDSQVAVFRADAIIRLGTRRRNRLDFSYVGYNRSAEKNLTEPIDLGGQTVIPGTLLDSKLDFSLIRSTYTYAILQNERVSLGLGLGVYIIPVSYGVEARVATMSSTLESHHATLPLPTVALRGGFQLVPKLFVLTELDGMYLDVSGIRAGLLDARVALEFDPVNHFGLGVGLNFLGINLQSTASNPDYPGIASLTRVEAGMSGLMLYGKFSF
jgi:hypothetical protein